MYSTDSVCENFFWFHLAGRPVVQTLTGQVGIDFMTVLKLPKMYLNNVLKHLKWGVLHEPKNEPYKCPKRLTLEALREVFICANHDNMVVFQDDLFLVLHLTMVSKSIQTNVQNA